MIKTSMTIKSLTELSKTKVSEILSINGRREIRIPERYAPQSIKDICVPYLYKSDLAKRNAGRIDPLRRIGQEIFTARMGRGYVELRGYVANSPKVDNLELSPLAYESIRIDVISSF